MAVHEAPVVIKKVKKVSGGGHHGGAWKVAYADFVTAMMAFFLLMWLVNATSPEQKQGVADYFAPASVSESRSGSGGILAGTALGEDGAMQAGSMNFVEQKTMESPQQDGGKAAADLEQASEEALREEIQKREDSAFRSAAQSLRQAMQDMPELAELSKNIIVDQTPEGLRIQLIDQEGRAMFDPGSSKPNERARTLLRAIGRVINQLPNRVSITGHTSAENSGAGSSADWPLSAARADASRQLLESSGIDSDRVAQVSGKAAKEPLYPNDPTLAGNRRIAIVLLREAPVLPEDPAL